MRTLEAPTVAFTLENTELGYLTVVANNKPWMHDEQDREAESRSYYRTLERSLPIYTMYVICILGTRNSL